MPKTVHDAVVEVLKDAERELAAIHKRQARLLAEIETVDKAVTESLVAAKSIIAAWEAAQRQRKPFGELEPLKNIESMAEAVRYVLQSVEVPLSPAEVGKKMVEWGYDRTAHTSEFTSSIYTVIKRLRSQGRVRVVEEGKRRPQYIWMK